METDKTKTGRQDQTDMSDTAEHSADQAEAGTASADMPREVNGPKGPEPTRYGDWEQKGRCSDF